MIRSTLRGLLLLTFLAAVPTSCSDDADLVRVDRVHEKASHWREVGWLKDGKRHGAWRIYDRDDGHLRVLEHWRNGVQEGLSMWFNDGVQVALDSWWRGGKKHGRTRYFFSDGRIAELGWFRNYKQEGVWCAWDYHSRRLTQLTEYRRGRVIRKLENPPGECPLTIGHGRRHMDPANRDYHWRPAGKTRRPLPMP